MAITSVSASGQLLKQIDELMGAEGYSSRSEVFRAGIRQLLDNRRAELSGQTKCVLVISYKTGNRDKLTKLQHESADLIETQMHTHLSKEMCTELLVLSGPGKRINELMKAFRRNGAERVVAIPP